MLAEHHHEPDTLVIDELALWYGTARIDVAVINGRMHGFEIKSDRDTLERLPGQTRIYNTVLDRVTLVVGAKHVVDATRAVPEWWGVKLVYEGPRGAVHFEEHRAPTTNPNIDSVAVAALLWCDEIEMLLLAADALRGYRGKSRDLLSRHLAEVMSLTDLRAAVRCQIRARGDWRTAARRT